MSGGVAVGALVANESDSPRTEGGKILANAYSKGICCPGQSGSEERNWARKGLAEGGEGGWGGGGMIITLGVKASIIEEPRYAFQRDCDSQSKAHSVRIAHDLMASMLAKLLALQELAAGRGGWRSLAWW